MLFLFMIDLEDPLVLFLFLAVFFISKMFTAKIQKQT